MRVLVRPVGPRLIVWLALVLVTLALALKNYETYQFGTYVDDARYTVLARSLISSDTYGMVNAPGPVQPERYPFGYPLLLSAVMRAFPDNLLALKLPSLVATILNMSMLFWGWRLLTRNQSWQWGAAVAGLYSLSTLTIEHAQQVMSEPIFTFFCLVALLLTEWRMVRGPVWWWPSALGLAVAGAVFTRSVGVVLMGTIVIYLLARLRGSFARELGLVLIQVLLVAGIVVTVTPVRARDLLPLEYLSDPNAVVLAAGVNRVTGADQPLNTIANSTTRPVTVWEMVWSNARYYLTRGIQDVALNLGGGSIEGTIADRLGVAALPMLIGAAISAFVALGLGRMLRLSGGAVFVWFAIAYLLSLALWSGSDRRLLYPVVPQLRWALLLGLEVTALALTHFTRIPATSRILTWFLVVGTIGLLLVSTIKSARLDDSRIHAGDLELRTGWLKAHTAATDVIMSEAPEVDYLYGGRKTVAYPTTASDSDLENRIRANGVKDVFVAPAIEWQSVYVPHYSNTTRIMLSELETLSLAGRATRVYQSDDGWLQVFHVSG